MTETNTTATETAPASSPKSGKKGAMILWIIGILLIGAVGFFGYKTLVKPGEPATGKIGSEQSAAAVVATVNGLDVTRAELDSKINQIRKTTPAGQPDPTQDAGFELKLLDEIVNLKLLVAEAQKEGITATDEQVNEELKKLADSMGGQDAFNKQLQATGITVDDLRENMKNEIMIRELVNRKTDVENVTASDEDVRASYDAATQGATTGVPAFEDVKDAVKAQVLQAKSADIVQAYIDELRKTADIKVTL